MGPETTHVFAYANSSFFKSRMAGSSPAMSSEELLVLERRDGVRREQALCLLLSPYLRALRCLPQFSKFPQRLPFLWLQRPPIKKKSLRQDVIKALLCVSWQSPEGALTRPMPGSTECVLRQCMMVASLRDSCPVAQVPLLPGLRALLSIKRARYWSWLP